MSLPPDITKADLPNLFVNTLGWDRRPGDLPIRALEWNKTPQVEHKMVLTGVAGKRGVQVFECPADVYGIMLGQSLRRLVQYEVRKAAHHNLIVFHDGGRKTQVWQWAEHEPGDKSLRVYERKVNAENAEEFAKSLLGVQFSLSNEHGLSIVDVVRRLQRVFKQGRIPNDKSGPKRTGLRAYDDCEVDQNIRFWWSHALKEPYMTKNEELRMLEAVRGGSAAAADRLVRAHLHLVARTVWRTIGGHSSQPDDYLDIVQACNLELIRVVPAFDPSCGYRFQTYLVRRLHNIISRIIGGEDAFIRLPRYVIERMYGLRKDIGPIVDQMICELERLPAKQEIMARVSEHYGVSVETVEAALCVQAGPISFDHLAANIDNDEDELEAAAELGREWSQPAVEADLGFQFTDFYDDIESAEASGIERLKSGRFLDLKRSREVAADHLVRREELNAMLDKLTSREREALRMRAGLNDGRAV